MFPVPIFHDQACVAVTSVSQMAVPFFWLVCKAFQCLADVTFSPLQLIQTLSRDSLKRV